MNRSIVFAVLIVAGLCGWMFSGLNAADETNGHPKAEQAPKSETSEPMKVQVVNSSAKPVQRLINVQGHVEALQLVKLKAEVDGRVDSFFVEEGTRVNAGAELIRLAEEYRAAQLAEARALLKKAQSDLKATQKLRKRGLQAENQVVADQAAVESARAQLAHIQYQIQHTRIKAPFSGVLNQRMVEQGDFVERGQQVAELVNDEQLVVTGQVPQYYVSGLKLGQNITIKLVTGLRLEGKLRFIAAMADDATRSYRVEVELNNPDHLRLIGLSATLQLPVEELTGHWVPGSVLDLDTEGKLQVKTLNDQNRVDIHTVELIRTDKDGFWISGLPQDIVLISIGQHFVGSGEKVTPVGVQQKDEVHANANLD